jgi:class 3 adenylate cyclase
LAREWLESAAPKLVGNEQLEARMARLDRHFMAPSTTVDWISVERETDVTAVLPLLRCPTLVLDHEASPSEAAESRHVQTMIPGAELGLISGDAYAMPFVNRAAIAEAVGQFVARERVAESADTVLATVLFTDIVGSTELQAAMGDSAWVDLVGRHHEIVRNALEQRRGVENDTAGDGFYATFDGPARAIRCALDVVSAMHDVGLEIRAGIHTGECQLVDGKHGGLAVTIGSRIAATSGPSEVLVSLTVKDLTAGSGFVFEDRGEYELKGVPEPWQLYRVTV